MTRVRAVDWHLLFFALTISTVLLLPHFFPTSLVGALVYHNNLATLNFSIQLATVLALLLVYRSLYIVSVVRLEVRKLNLGRLLRPIKLLHRVRQWTRHISREQLPVWKHLLLHLQQPSDQLLLDIRLVLVVQ